MQKKVNTPTRDGPWFHDSTDTFSRFVHGVWSSFVWLRKVKVNEIDQEETEPPPIVCGLVGSYELVEKTV